MPLPRLLATLCAASVLVATAARAQPLPPVSPPVAAPAPVPGPAPASEAAPSPPVPPAGEGAAPAAAAPAPTPAAEALETPYADVPPAPPAAPAASPIRVSVPAITPADIRPIRSLRKLALTAELGWNGLAGFGPVLTYNAHPHVAVDLGTGFSLFGWKVGLRGRYNILTSNFTPFLGAGFNATSGLGELPFNDKNDPDADPNRDVVTINVKPSYLVQGVLGFDYIHRRGFTMIGCVGFAKLLNTDNVELVEGSGEPNHEERMAIDVLFGSGAVISMSLGYSWE